MAENMEAPDILGFQQAKHIQCDGFGFIAIIGFIAIGVSAKVRGYERKAVGKSLYDWKELTMVLRPAMHTEDDRAAACHDIVKIDAVRLGAFMHQCERVVRRPLISRFFSRRGSCRGNCS